MLDCTSNFVTAIKKSLKVGTVRQCKFDVEFRLDVFRLMFDGKGQSAPRGRGMTYTKADFPNNFPPDWDVTFDKHGDGCAIDFPIRLYPHIKFAPVFYRKVDDSVEVCNREGLHGNCDSICDKKSVLVIIFVLYYQDSVCEFHNAKL